MPKPLIALEKDGFIARNDAGHFVHWSIWKGKKDKKKKDSKNEDDFYKPLWRF